MSGTEARDYLAADFDLQGADYEPHEGAAYSAFADYLRSLPGDDHRMLELEQLLVPFLRDDAGLDGTLYPDGEAIRMMDRDIPGELYPFEDYLGIFLSLLAQDHRRWTAHLAERGAQAVWTLESGRPEVTVCLRHVEVIGTTEPAVYADWADYLSRTKEPDRRAMCAARINRANGDWPTSRLPQRKLTTEDVWQMVASAQGRCVHCGSLCLQRMPHDPVTKKKLPWAAVGRRIGSVHHLVRRADGGSNDPENLAWSCMWCNTYACERTSGALDHGGLQI